MFDTDAFIEECTAAVKTSTPQVAVKEVVERAISAPTDLERAFGPIERGGIQPVYRSENLTILHVVWTPRMVLYPHNHQMWGIIGMYGGQEDNSFYRRRADGQGLELINGRSIRDRDILPMGDRVIHSVENPLDRFTTALHVYGGDFFGTPRSEWPSPSSPEQPWDVQRAMRAFEEANERLHSSAGD